jgi:hypothetical protein
MEDRLDEVRPAEVRPAEVRPDKVRPEEVRRAELRPMEVRPAEVRPVEERPAEVRLAEVRLVEVRPEVRHEEVRPTEVRPVEVRPVEVRPAEVRKDVWVLSAPCVPRVSALLEYRDVTSRGREAVRSVTIAAADRGSLSRGRLQGNGVACPAIEDCCTGSYGRVSRQSGGSISSARSSHTGPT